MYAGVPRCSVAIEVCVLQLLIDGKGKPWPVQLPGYQRQTGGTDGGSKSISRLQSLFEINWLRDLVESVNRTIR